MGEDIQLEVEDIKPAVVDGNTSEFLFSQQDICTYDVAESNLALPDKHEADGETTRLTSSTADPAIQEIQTSESVKEDNILDECKTTSVEERLEKPEITPPEQNFAPSEPEIAPPGHNFAPSEQEIAPPEQEIVPPEQEIASPVQEIAPPGQEIVPPEQEIELVAVPENNQSSITEGETEECIEGLPVSEKVLSKVDPAAVNNGCTEEEIVPAEEHLVPIEPHWEGKACYRISGFAGDFTMQEVRTLLEPHCKLESLSFMSDSKYDVAFARLEPLVEGDDVATKLKDLFSETEHKGHKLSVVLSYVDWLLFIGNLRRDIDDSQLRRMFEPHGRVERAFVMKNSEGKSKAYGFVEYSLKSQASVAKAKMGNIDMDGRVLRVEWTEVRKTSDLFSSVIFVDRIPKEVPGITEKLRKLFEEYGKVRECQLVTGTYGQQRGFAFVDFYNSLHAEKAHEALDGHVFFNSAIRVSFANPAKKEQVFKPRPTSQFPGQHVRGMFGDSQGVRSFGVSPMVQPGTGFVHGSSMMFGRGSSRGLAPTFMGGRGGFGSIQRSLSIRGVFGSPLSLPPFQQVQNRAAFFPVSNFAEQMRRPAAMGGVPNFSGGRYQAPQVLGGGRGFGHSVQGFSRGGFPTMYKQQGLPSQYHVSQLTQQQPPLKTDEGSSAKTQEQQGASSQQQSGYSEVQSAYAQPQTTANQQQQQEAYLQQLQEYSQQQGAYHQDPGYYSQVAPQQDAQDPYAYYSQTSANGTGATSTVADATAYSQGDNSSAVGGSYGQADNGYYAGYEQAGSYAGYYEQQGQGSAAANSSTVTGETYSSEQTYEQQWAAYYAAQAQQQQQYPGESGTAPESAATDYSQQAYSSQEQTTATDYQPPGISGEETERKRSAVSALGQPSFDTDLERQAFMYAQQSAYGQMSSEQTTDPKRARY